MQLGTSNGIRCLLLNTQPTVDQVGKIESEVFKPPHHAFEAFREFKGVVVDGGGGCVEVASLLPNVIDLGLEPTRPVQSCLSLLLNLRELLAEDLALGGLVQIDSFQLLPKFGEPQASSILHHK